MYISVIGRWAIRISVVLDAALVERVKKLTRINTTWGIVVQALRLLVRLSEQAEVRELRGKLHWEGNLDEMRESLQYDR